MLLKKLLLSLFIMLSGTIITASPMLREIPVLPANIHDESPVPLSTFFKIHTHHHCIEYSRKNPYKFDVQFAEDSSAYFIKKNISYARCWPKECFQTDLFEHTPDIIIISFHDESRKTIAILDGKALGLEESVLLSYLKKRLDPNTKPKAITAKIKNNKRQHISFFDNEGNKILFAPFEQKNIPHILGDLNKNLINELEEFIDLSELETIKDHRSPFNECILF